MTKKEAIAKSVEILDRTTRGATIERVRLLTEREVDLVFAPDDPRAPEWPMGIWLSNGTMLVPMLDGDVFQTTWH